MKRKWILLLIILLIFVMPYKVETSSPGEYYCGNLWMESLTYRWFSTRSCEGTVHRNIVVPIISYEYITIMFNVDNVGETHYWFAVWDNRGFVAEDIPGTGLTTIPPKLFEWKW